MKKYDERVNKINVRIEELRKKLRKEYKEDYLSWLENTTITKEDKMLKQLEDLYLDSGYECVGYLDGGYPDMQEQYTEEQLKEIEVKIDEIEKEIK